ncbi:MAG: hypothetical protein IAB88_05315 [Bacteroidetes bacterium]|uniref:RHS repeat-associated core domain-containing protein n=1 Tax=Candidatus Limisoma faecipullorum TaxID=2840854 RepID=A0A9D9IQU3_9BACT|nr:hypothetical protein [Candidatus Limisoma faecipullorum]
MEKIISFILAILLAGLNAYGVWKKAVLVCVDSALPENKDYTYLLKHYGVKKAVKTITDTSRIEDLYELLAHSKKIELKKPDNGCFCVYIKGDSSSINIIGGTKDMLIGSSLYETNRELLSKIYELSEFNYSRYLNLDDINIEDIDFVDIKSVMPNIFTTRDVLFYEFDDFFKGELKNSRIFCKPHILCVINALTTKRESENNNDMPIIDTRFVMDIHLKGGKDVIKIYGNESLFVVNNNVYKTDSIVSNLIWNTDYLRDNLGSVRVEVDGEGEVVRGADYSSTGVPMERRWRSPSGLELYGGKQYYGIRDLGWYDNSARTLESVMQRFTSMDPLCEKYPSISPYAYCMGNPVNAIDPDGKEVINGIDENPSEESKKRGQTPEGNRIISQLAKNYRKYKDNNDKIIHLFAHGASQAISIGGETVDNELTITSAKELDAYLSENSKIWQKKDRIDGVVLVLHSCSTGKGKNSIAEQMSEAFPDIKVIAPSEDIQATSVKEMSISPTSSTSNKEEGAWKVFKEGIYINAFDVNKNFNDYPTFGDRFKEIINYLTRKDW